MLSFIYRCINKASDLLRTSFIKRIITKDSSVPKTLGKIYLQVKNLKCGKNVTIYPGAYLWGNSIEIGDNVDIGIGTIIYAKERVKIGSNTIIAGQCYIIDSNHGTRKNSLVREQSDDTEPGGIEIGSDVWIGAQCSILKGARISNGAIIGAQSLVNNAIPENAIVVGSPSKIIKYRD